MFDFDFEHNGARYTFKVEFINNTVHSELFKYINTNKGKTNTINHLRRISMFKNTNSLPDSE